MDTSAEARNFRRMQEKPRPRVLNYFPIRQVSHSNKYTPFNKHKFGQASFFWTSPQLLWGTYGSKEWFPWCLED